LVQVRALISPLRRVRGMFYGWWLAGVAALVMVLGTVPFFQGMPAWNVALENHFHWSRGQLALAFSLSRVEGSIMGPVGGYLTDRLGPRRMVLVGLLILGAGFLLFSQVRQLWQFYLAFVVMSMGAGMGTWLPMMTVLNNWFIRRRSIAMAIAMDGFYIGGIVLVPALAWAIDPAQPDRIGWRGTAAAIGLVIIVLAFPISRLVRNRPEEYGYQPDGRPVAPRVTSARSSGPLSPGREPEYTWQQALRTRAFWLITMGHACSSIVIVTVTVHLGLMLSDRGFSLPLVGWVVAVYTAVGGVFTMVGGYLGDRVPPKVALFGFSILQSAAMIVLLMAHSTPMALLFAVLLGIGVGGRTPLTTAIRGVYFGRRAFASITGVSMVPMNVLLLLAPWFAGYMFDATGSYTIPFIAVAVVSGLGSGLFLLLRPPTTSAPRRAV